VAALQQAPPPKKLQRDTETREADSAAWNSFFYWRSFAQGRDLLTEDDRPLQ